MNEAIKYAWAYLLTYGKLTNGKWDYYGGWEEASPWKYGETEKRAKKWEDIKNKALTIGIDWDKTGVPKVSEEGVFAGTFASQNEYDNATLGELVLKNGETFLIGSSDEDAAHLAEAARELMRGKSTIMELADKL